MIEFADLHIHTNYSDGTMSPQEVVEAAIAGGLRCIAITDHDTLEAVPSAQEAARGTTLEVIPGIELTSEIYESDVHLLGYLLDPAEPALASMLLRLQQMRRERLHEMIEKLRSLGISDITFEEVRILTQSESVGRLHLATVLQQKGWVKTIREAFNKYLADDAAAYVHKPKLNPYEAIALIRQARGIAVLAHPMVTNKDELMPSLVEAGLQGLEVYYPNFSDEVIGFYEKMAKKYDLVATGGSDAHGKAKWSTYIGKKCVPYSTVEQLKMLCT